MQWRCFLLFFRLMHCKFTTSFPLNTVWIQRNNWVWLCYRLFFSPPQLSPLLCLFWRLIQQQAIVPAQGGTPDFKWQGRSNGGKYRNHPKSLGLQTKKSLDQTIPPPPPEKKKSHGKFPNHKNFQRNYAAGIRGNYYEIPPKVPTKLKLPWKILTKIFLPEKSRYWKFQTPKKFDHPCHLKSRVYPLGKRVWKVTQVRKCRGIYQKHITCFCIYVTGQIWFQVKLFY